MLPTQRTALVEMTRWSCSIIASAPPAHSAFTTAWTSCWCTTMCRGWNRRARSHGQVGVVEGDLQRGARTGCAGGGGERVGLAPDLLGCGCRGRAAAVAGRPRPCRSRTARSVFVGAVLGPDQVGQPAWPRRSVPSEARALVAKGARDQGGDGDTATATGGTVHPSCVLAGRVAHLLSPTPSTLGQHLHATRRPYVPESKGRAKASYTPPRTPRNRGQPALVRAAHVRPLHPGPPVDRDVLRHRRTSIPIPGVGHWNLAVGFGLLMAGFVMTTRWR